VTRASIAFPPDPDLRRWLLAEGSLTSRLRRHGTVEVRVQQQGRRSLWAQEEADLHVSGGYVREVVLLLNGRPAVWARSATTQRAIQGPWSALRGLGSRPLAELLFAGRHVERELLQAHHLARCGLQANHIQGQWLALQQLSADAALPQSGLCAALPRWARSSVFWRHGHPLRVMEAFSPWVAALKPV
jgi:chorismate--pyruvate lyase